MQIENAMVMRNGYGIADPQEVEPRVIGECFGCGSDIYDQDEALEYLGDILLHEDIDCILEYIQSNSVKVGPDDH